MNTLGIVAECTEVARRQTVSAIVITERTSIVVETVVRLCLFSLSWCYEFGGCVVNLLLLINDESVGSDSSWQR
eukprot:m.68366 g.68366  ORF g.68366 m.68366 type:complete len:74 (+) comp23946_c0_seq3:1285-1506(+)